MLRIVSWEILKGLPGEGSPPMHFHLGHPTPWAEGFVVRFRNDDDREWVGNFQRGCCDLSGLLHWSEAGLIVVFANGAFYLIPQDEPTRYSAHGDQATAAIFDEQRTVLVVAYGYGDLVAFDQQGKRKWAQESLGAFGLALKSCTNGIITAEVGTDYDDSWRTMRLSALDGASI